MATWGMTWGYIFVIVIAGLALLVGRRKGLILKKKAENKVEKSTAESPELEQVEAKPDETNDNSQANGKESEKTE